MSRQLQDIKKDIRDIKNWMNVKGEEDKHVKRKVTEIEGRLERLEKFETARTVVLFGVAEEEGENLEELITLLLQILNTKLKMEMGLGNIYKVERMGRAKRTDGKGRPIKVVFCSELAATMVLREARELKGTGIGVEEFRTKEEVNERRVLAYHRRRAMGAGDVAHIRGNCLLVHGRGWRRIFTIQELTQPSVQGTSRKQMSKAAVSNNKHVEKVIDRTSELKRDGISGAVLGRHEEVVVGAGKANQHTDVASG